ncbi:TetR/AcrR family transcriptional regulator [Nocardia abscessus]|uniref:TetR/AcrR family transcriptional regulator n=1 Tax=Nocardia abscessus TaxID=120957 RepID=UPI001C3F2B77|nr:TetR/AcrR family transcriptional regulator [Nocardia abscessus]MCC3332052.1 TetR/AcrR family transcriptional regulator [Nocardia abscessus]
MPLPRFLRLPEGHRTHMLQIARHRVAVEGPEGAVFNKIIDGIPISKTAAYQYFDGREDLLATVLADVRGRVHAVLGDRRYVDTSELFWQQLGEGAVRLTRHLDENPDDLQLAEVALGSAAAAYLGAVLNNGRAIGVGARISTSHSCSPRVPPSSRRRTCGRSAFCATARPRNTPQRSSGNYSVDCGQSSEELMSAEYVNKSRPDVDIDWLIPEIPGGLAGAWDRISGPGKTRSDRIAGMPLHLLIFAMVFIYMWHAEIPADWTLWKLGLLAVSIFDLAGGIITNSTNAAKRWMHRPGPDVRRGRLQFIAGHILYLAIVSFVFLHGDWAWLLGNSALLMIGALLIEFVAIEQKRLTAMGLYILAVLINATWLPVPAVLAWFPILFFLKLLISTLVPEAPMIRAETARYQ